MTELFKSTRVQLFKRSGVMPHAQALKEVADFQKNMMY